MTRTDIIIAVIILAVGGMWLSAGVIVGNSADQVAVLEVEGEEWERFDLAKAGRYTVDLNDGRQVVVETDEGRIRMIDTDICPQKICVHTNWIQRPGQAIVCLPNRVVIRILTVSSSSDNRIDAVTGP